MGVKTSEIIKILEGIAERLDEVIAETGLIDVDDQVGYEEGDYDADIDNNAGRIESGLLTSENRVDEIKLVLSEEIDNIRRLMEIIEE